MILTLDAVKEYLKIEHDEEDDYIESLIRQSSAAAEDYCRVSFTAGESDTEDFAIGELDKSSVPEPVKLAVLLMVSSLYENRDLSDKTMYTTMRMAFENLLYPYRDESLMF